MVAQLALTVWRSVWSWRISRQSIPMNVCSREGSAIETHGAAPQDRRRHDHDPSSTTKPAQNDGAVTWVGISPIGFDIEKTQLGLSGVTLDMDLTSWADAGCRT